MEERAEPFDLRDVLRRVSAAENLSEDEMSAVMGAIMDGRCDPLQISGLLTALAMKGESDSEVAGAARSMRERVTRIPTSAAGLLDTCGTGGDGLHTFNISTATAIVAAAAGMRVAKHGNRSVSSSSGSADVLEALGVKIDLTPEQVGACIAEIGIGFCFAPLLHGAMKYAVPVRRALGFRTIFNLLGPLTNPAAAEHQLLGANNVETAEKLAHALAALGTAQSVVVAGADGLDECSLWGETQVFVVTTGNVERRVWTPGDFGLAPCTVAELRVSSAAESAEVVRGVLTNEDTAARRVVIMNTGAALFASERVSTPAEGAELALEAILSGAARATLEKLISWTTNAA